MSLDDFMKYTKEDLEAFKEYCEERCWDLAIVNHNEWLNRFMEFLGR